MPKLPPFGPALGLAAALLPSTLAAGPDATLGRFEALHARQGLESGSVPGEDLLDAAFLKETLFFLADDARKGRKPGSPQLEVEVFGYLTERLAAWGLEPAGNAAKTSYLQPFKASSWWPFLGETEPEVLPVHDDELYCGEPNRFGVALDPAGRPVTLDEAEFLARIGRDSLDDEVRELGLRASYDTHNVAAMLPGSDPALADEVIVLGAHIDHLGASGANIYNGADDNASGSTILLGLARAFAQLKKDGQGPKRSILFLWFSAEEMGLLGSLYWVKTPTIPLARVKAMLNMDMLGRTETDEVSVYCGTEAAREASFHAWHDADGLGFARVPHDIESYLRRSDQYSFYKKGIPVMFFFEGFQGSAGQAMNPDYHRASDDPPKIDLSKLGRSARFIYRHAWRASFEALPPAVEPTR